MTDARVEVEQRLRHRALARLSLKKPSATDIADAALDRDAADMIARLHHSGKVAAGEKLVPIEPTQAMKEAATEIVIDALDDRHTALNWEEAGEVWSAMLAASPTGGEAVASDLRYAPEPDTIAAQERFIRELNAQSTPSPDVSSSGGMSDADGEDVRRAWELAKAYDDAGRHDDALRVIAGLRQPEAAVSVGMPTREEIARVLTWEPPMTPPWDRPCAARQAWEHALERADAILALLDRPAIRGEGA